MLQGFACTPASDVFSFGMTMYEVFSRKEPYEDDEMELNQLLVSIVRRKHRPLPPKIMPTGFAHLMKVCTQTGCRVRAGLCWPPPVTVCFLWHLNLAGMPQRRPAASPFL